MAWADLLPQFPHLQIQSIQQEDQCITITMVSTRESDQCRTCQTQTVAGHGWFDCPHTQFALFGPGSRSADSSSPLSLHQRCLSTPRRSEKISLRLLIGISVELKRQHICCAA
jgi:hypothetical protein